ncbi:MAG: FtsQ-type POTRA domain-containing protein [Oscillospiraceae bacterium]|nr:FtsQ-type POTRA domain-containing protein [Oscillospiraceae bacterium]
MKDVEKTNIERENSIKRLRRRRRSMGIYGLFVIIAVLGIGMTLSCTFLFNVNEVVMTGSSDRYSADDIINQSEIKGGDNLIKLDTGKVRQKLLELKYVEDASVNIKFPSTVEIDIEPCVPAFNIVYKLGSVLISERGKILETSQTSDEIFPSFYGYEPLSPECGNMIDTEDERQKEVFEEFVKVLNERDDKSSIESVDITNRSNIIVKFRNGNIFKMGSWNDCGYKLTLASKVMEETGKVGYITMVGTNQCSFRTTDGSFSSNVITTAPEDESDEDTSTQTTAGNPEDLYDD